jgi:hypothetical protein
VKNWQKAISTEEKLDIIIQLEKHQHHNVTLTHSSICAIHCADAIKESAKSGTKVWIETTFQFLYLGTGGVKKWGKTKEGGGGAQIIVSSLTRGTPSPPCPHSVNTFQVSRNGN